MAFYSERVEEPMDIHKLILIFAGAATLFAQADITLERATLKERLEGDLKGAIELYRRAYSEAKSDRAVAAKALIRMADCYQKLGDDESRKIYEQVVRDFPDQKEALAVAQSRIGGKARNTGTVTRLVWTGPIENTWNSVSPDGRYASFSDKQSGDLALHDLETGKDRLLTHHKAGDHAHVSLISRDGKQVAYVWFNSTDRGFELRLLGLHGNSPATPRVLYKQNPDVRYPGPWAWTADGKWIAVQLQRLDRTVQIALVSTADGSLRVLKSVGWNGAGNMAFSPDGQYLAYDVSSSQDPQGKDVFVLATDGSREHPAVVHPNSINKPVDWTPDGKHLLFTSNRSGVSSLWAQPIQNGKSHGVPKLIRSDVNNIMGMTKSGALYYRAYPGGDGELYTATIDLASGNLLSPPVPESAGYFVARWSPDGKFLAYGPTQGGQMKQIRIRSIETGQARELRPKLRYINDFCWSSDGRSFAVSGADDKGRHGVYRFDSETGEIELLFLPEVISAGQYITSQPRCVPGGKKILYARRFREPGDASISEDTIVERDLTSGKERELVKIKPFTVGPTRFAPSPDGRFIAYETRDKVKKHSSITLLPVAGGEPRELLRFNDPQSLELNDWTPDGAGLVVRKVLSTKGDGELWLFPVTGGEPRKIGIDDPRAHAVSVHPDGRRISYMVQGAFRCEVVALENFLPTLEAAQ
jgi:Tol biopolymer transport system component